MLFNFIKTYFYYYNTDNFSFIFYTCREEESRCIRSATNTVKASI